MRDLYVYHVYMHVVHMHDHKNKNNDNDDYIYEEGKRIVGEYMHFYFGFISVSCVCARVNM